MPFTLASALVIFWPAVGTVIVTVGLVTSTKLTCSVRFDSIMNCTAALFVFTPPNQSVEITQLVKLKPLAGVAAML